MSGLARPHFEFLDNGGFPLAFAHQGGAAAGTEKRNTMPAFSAAHKLGYRYFETDVISSADGLVVIAHGSSGKKENQKSGLPIRYILQQMTYEEMKKVYKPGGEDMPLLEEVIDAFPDTRINIDPKTKEVVSPLATLLSKKRAVGRVCIGSFSYATTKGVAELLGGQNHVCTAVGPMGAVALKTRMIPGYLAHMQAACLQLPHQHVSERMVDTAHSLDLAVHVWTPNEASDFERSLVQGVDGIMTDAVENLRTVFIGRNSWTPNLPL